MATLSDISYVARNYLRDFAKFFQVSFDVTGRTYQLGHINIDPTTAWVAVYTPTVSTSASTLAASQYTLDSRNGYLRLAFNPSTTATVMVEGYYYEWLTPDDLTFYAQRAVNLNLHNLGLPLDNLAPAVVDLIGVDCLVEALWGLTTEFSRDIDVITSESIHIPASQRFRMVESLLQFWMAEYEKRARALNIGLDRIEIFNLRRVSRTTGRLVPEYKDREIGDYGPLDRIWVPIPTGEMIVEDPDDKLRTDVFIEGTPPENVMNNYELF